MAEGSSTVCECQLLSSRVKSGRAEGMGFHRPKRCRLFYLSRKGDIHNISALVERVSSSPFGVLDKKVECAVSSVVEHYLDTVGVGSSILPSRTTFCSGKGTKPG